ncbi:MAG: oxidoreductase [Candidatus Omnitrophica bacterium]|nr:oxidoreductase [Candidatus Omnitrophota bacterium]
MEKKRSSRERVSLYFEEPGKVRARKEDQEELNDEEVLVTTRLSAISAGTELLFYRGQVPDNMPVDISFEEYSGAVRYPLKYGYSAAGEITDAGRFVPRQWIGRRVFSFNPHESSFCRSLSDLILLPEDMAYEDAVFLPSIETAVNLLHEAKPLIGENVLIIGQGMIGLMATSLIAGMPELLVTLDKNPLRCGASLSMGSSISFDSSSGSCMDLIKEELDRRGQGAGFDLILELSGDPSSLDTAISLAGTGGRIIVGSWYGRKKHAVDLGSSFHRKNLTITSSQVSTVPAFLRNSWTKARRFELCLRLLARIRPSHFISHCFDIHKAQEAYTLLDKEPEKSMQVVFTYGD